jgi:putative transposase
MQVELLDRQVWVTRQQLANAIFEWIEAWYNPVRRHSALDYHSPVDYERLHTPPLPRPNQHTPHVRETGGRPT